MLSICLLRHGQTLFNLEETVQGHNDSPLTELGIFQAKCAGYGARQLIFDCAFAGSTKRQVATAEIFLKENLHPVEVREDDRFREMCYGKYEGGKYYDMLNPLYEKLNETYQGYEGLYRHYSDMEIAARLEENDETGRFEGSEKTFLRLKQGLDHLSELHDGKKILISTSSFAICTLLSHLFPELHQERLVENASLTFLEYGKEQCILKDYNDISFRESGERHFLASV